MEHEVYEIENIQDIADMVTPNNVDNFIKDFRAFLLGYMMAKTAGGGESIPVKTFTWIDDGKVDAKLTMTVDGKPDESLELRVFKNEDNKEE